MTQGPTASRPTAAAAGDDELTRAVLHHQAGELAEAEALYRAALARQPDDAPVLNLLGQIRLERGDAQEAAALLGRAWQLAPQTPGLALVLGQALHAHGQLAAARDCLQQARQAAAADTGLLAELASVEQDDGHFAAAAALLRERLALAPDDAHAAWHLALALLSLGELDAGWAQYEARSRVFGVDYTGLGMQRWDGTPLDGDGEALLLLAEQGVGDEILFASCVPDALARAGSVTLFCDPRLQPLFARSFPGASVLPLVRGGGVQRSVERPACTHYLEAGSLPRWFRRRIEDFPAVPGYLLADAARAAHWRRWLAGLGKGLKIGLCWRSGLRGGARERHYAALEAMAPLFGVPGVRWVSVQYDPSAPELAAAQARFGVPIAEPPGLDQRNALDEVAALLDGLDLVISASTAVAELAAALGVPVWRFLTGSGWPMLGTDAMPWHPTQRLWSRPPDQPDWQPTFTAMAQALAKVPPRERPVDAVASRQLDAALALFRKGRHAAAREAAVTLTGQRPDLAGVWHLLGLAAREGGEGALAHAAFVRALTLTPQEPSLAYNFGALAERGGALDLAIHLYRRALRLAGDWPEARLALAETLTRRGGAALDANAAAAALPDFEAALALEPTLADAWNNAGLALLRAGRPQEGCAAHDTAQQLAPADVRYRWNAAYTRLAAGDLAGGWADYRWRWRGIHVPNDYPFPEAASGESLAGRHVLVFAEQGLGDEILFSTCLPDLLAEARAVTLECDPRLVPLYARSFPGVRLIGSRRSGLDWERLAADIDVKLPLGELACRYRPRLDAFPPQPALPLRAGADAVRYWQQRLHAVFDAGVTVGLVWRSGLRAANRTNLYPPLAGLARTLAARAQLRVVVLQHDAEPAELEALTAAGVPWWRPEDLDLRDDLDGLAALLTALDLTLGAATATTELAGALGRPAWRLYPYPAWVALGSGGCPWHPQMLEFTRAGGIDAPWEALLAGLGATLDAALAPVASPAAPTLAALLDELLGEGQCAVLAGDVSAEWALPEVMQRLGPDGLLLRFDPDGTGPAAGTLWPGRLAATEAPAVTAATPAAWLAAQRQREQTLDGLKLPHCDWLVSGADTDAAAVLAGATQVIARCRPFLLLGAAAAAPAGYTLMECRDDAGRAWRLAFPLPQSDTNGDA